MPAEINIIQTPVFIVIFLFLFVSLFLFTHNKGKKVSNYLLGILFLCYSLWIWDIYAIYILYDRYPSLAYIFNNLLWLIGPCTLFYTRSVIYKDFRLKGIDLFHLIPFVIATLFTIFAFHIRSTDFKRTFLEHALKDTGPLNWGSSVLIISYGFTYTIIAFKAILRYQKILSNKLSNAGSINLSWLKFMLIGYIIIFLSLVAIIGLQYLKWEGHFPIRSLYILIPVLLIFITTILFKSLKQPEIFSGISTEEIKEELKYIHSRLTKEDSGKYAEILENYMYTKKPYLEPDLSINDLAEKLNINVRIISQVINDELGSRFFDYINKYRIEEAKSLMKNPLDPKMTILEIMYDTGFNSKSSFNTAFKKFTGKTPSDYKKHFKNTSVSD